jgi:hypothetical protein
MNHQHLLDEIRKSKKYKNIAKEVIKNEIEDFMKKYPGWQKLKDKTILKELKSGLHKKHASFSISSSENKKEKYIEQLKKEPTNFEIVKKILSTNRSTKERLNFYEDLYEKIFNKEPKRIIDLGCGLNPISSIFMPKPLVYYSYDINEKDAEFINKFFKTQKIIGQAMTLDLTKTENYEKIPGSDICLMFKFIDSIEEGRADHRLGEEIIKIMMKKTKIIIVSFSKMTLSGNKMNFPHRGWFERMLTRLKLEFKKLEFNNEVFYIINR